MKLRQLYEQDTYKDVTFTRDELVDIFKPFIQKLVNDHGNDREQMIKTHIDKLVGLPYKQVIKKMPRGPTNSQKWKELLQEIKIELEEQAKAKIQGEDG